MDVNGKSEIVVLFKFFGRRDPSQDLKKFSEECKALNKEEKHALAVAAAHEMGMNETELSFPLN